MSSELQSAESTRSVDHEASVQGDPTWILQSLEVFNWGPFSGMHRADFDARGTAIIGPTGSGKTTLVDALMTLLVASPRYNLASTGGHESDRTLMSYVRGAHGGNVAEGSELFSRPQQTYTGICATYRAGEEALQLAGLLWIDGKSTSTKDLKRRWIFCQAPQQSLEQWLRILHEENVRELMRRGRETAQLRIFESKKAYLAHIRKFFDVGENAFNLLNRAAGLKQLNSIDEIFRELVLDDRSAFDRALEVASEFDNLAGIHAELETAKRQQESLLPIAKEYRKLTKAQEKLHRLRTLKRILPVWFATIAQQLWQQRLESIGSSKLERVNSLQSEQQDFEQKKAHVDTLQQKYLSLGGDAIGGLEEAIKLHREKVANRKREAEQYLQAARMFELDETLSQSALKSNQEVLQIRRATIDSEHQAAEQETLAVRSAQRDAEQQVADLIKQLEQIKRRPGSNIPIKFQDFRGQLAAELSLEESALPFLAELVEVKAKESAWRGAIERAIGSERLRILVPARQLNAALQWVDGRDNRLHVRLQAAGRNEPTRSFFADGISQKLNFKQHDLIGAAKDLLARHDRHCVASAEQLRNVDHGLTIEGTMSGRSGKFEKQDQRRLDENWMTGFDNKDQLESLGRKLKDAQSSESQLAAECKALLQQQKIIEGQLSLLDRLVKTDYESIDLPGALAELESAEKRLAALLDPNSDTSRAKEQFDAASSELEQIRQRIKNIENELARLDERQSQAEQSHHQCTVRVGNGIEEDETALAESQFALPENLQPELIANLEHDAGIVCDAKLQTATSRVAEHENRLIKFMGKAKSVDTGALSEVDANLQDIDQYLERLRVLNDEALPEKRQRFLAYLNQSSDQGVTQLLAGIREEVDLIEHRIQELNHTLMKVEFRSGRFLQLEPQRIKHERLRTLQAAQRRLVSAAMKEDEGESEYNALREVVAILREAGENRYQLGSKALLDPRYQLQFFVVEADGRTGERSPRRSGSQSGSGGEKETMASHILTASLSYALCPAGAHRPLYGSVVLDEAFSKSSASAATRIIEALNVFGLHPIFVTPNKEIGLLKKHTRQAICVHRSNSTATLASISWEQLKTLAPRAI